MRRPPTCGRPALAPMRTLPVLLIAALVACGGGAFAMNALDAGGGERALGLSISPARQSAVPGRLVTFDVAVRPAKRPVTLRVSRLPAGLRAFFRLADGRRSHVVPSGQDGAILTVVGARSSGFGAKRIMVTARSGGRSQTQAASLVLRRRPLALRVRPARLTLLPGERGALQVRHTGAEWLWVRGLPRGVRAAWKPARGGSRLLLRASRGAAPASRRVVVFARDRLVQRAAVVVVNVREGHPFQIAGDLGPPLYPGRSEPLELRLTNPNDFAIRVMKLTVSIRPATTQAGCSAANYAVEQYRGPYPLVLRPGTSSLGQLAADRSLWPRVAMLNLPVNQDACKGATITLDFRGKAVR
jgi:hypothetical protein